MFEPKFLRRIEGMFVFIACLLFYNSFAQSWVLFLILFLLPDLSMLGYLINQEKGAIIYNQGHWYGWAIIAGTYGAITGSIFALSIALTWAAHIGFDRMLGYGFKLKTGFKHTDLKTL